MSEIVFSADFGGLDASDAVLPELLALKAAARGISVEEFPFPQLGFILRVDGEVSQFEFSGLDNLDVDTRGKYLSVDIGVTIEDRQDLKRRMVSSILDSPGFIEGAARGKKFSTKLAERMGVIDYNALKAPLELLCSRYMSGVA